MKPGCSPAAWNRGAGPPAGLLDAPCDLGVEGREVVVGRGGDDVLARVEERDDVVRVRVRRERPAGGVEDEVGVEGEDRLLVVAGEHAGVVPADARADVPADLVLAVDEQPDELEVGGCR
jgi:hypothetical protein